jgi:RimJ/RimL family protein N-acetyltransferase
VPPLRPPEPLLADARVTLRPWADGDVAWLARESRDPLVPRFTSVPERNSERDVRAFLLAQGPLRERGEQLHLLAVETTSGARVGPVGLHHVDWTHRSAEVGYWTARAARGRGSTAAAVRLLCAWALGPLGLERLELRADVENIASQRVARACGFTREGVLRSAAVRPGGRASLVVFGLLAGELTRP